ncbi:MAG: hypothetical protein ABI882_16040 [Acidobacteriota bacterium]
MTSETPERHSRNLTILILILFFYVVCAYAPAFAGLTSIRINSWEVAIGYWVLIGLALRNWGFLATQTFSLLAFGVVLTILQKVTFAISYEMVRETTGSLSLPVVILLFVVGPGIFFSFNFDPYGLVRELPRIANVRATAHLLLMLSAGEMFQARFSEVSENLMVRGVNVASRARRLLSVPTFLPPLLMALIQEAAYRHSYTAMLGCPPDRFPKQRARTRVSLPQKLALVVAIVLLLLSPLI